MLKNEVHDLPSYLEISQVVAIRWNSSFTDDPRACIHAFARTIRGEIDVVPPLLRPVSA
jgi:hypothetical protein